MNHHSPPRPILAFVAIVLSLVLASPALAQGNPPNPLSGPVSGNLTYPNGTNLVINNITLTGNTTISCPGGVISLNGNVVGTGVNGALGVDGGSDLFNCTNTNPTAGGAGTGGFNLILSAIGIAGVSQGEVFIANNVTVNLDGGNGAAGGAGAPGFYTCPCGLVSATNGANGGAGGPGGDFIVQASQIHVGSGVTISVDGGNGSDGGQGGDTAHGPRAGNAAGLGGRAGNGARGGKIILDTTAGPQGIGAIWPLNVYHITVGSIANFTSIGGIGGKGGDGGGSATFSAFPCSFNGKSGAPCQSGRNGGSGGTGGWIVCLSEVVLAGSNNAWNVSGGDAGDGGNGGRAAGGACYWDCNVNDQVFEPAMATDAGNGGTGGRAGQGGNVLVDSSYAGWIFPYQGLSLGQVNITGTGGVGGVGGNGGTGGANFTVDIVCTAQPGGMGFTGGTAGNGGQGGRGAKVTARSFTGISLGDIVCNGGKSGEGGIGGQGGVSPDGTGGPGGAGGTGGPSGNGGTVSIGGTVAQSLSIASLNIEGAFRGAPGTGGNGCPPAPSPAAGTHGNDGTLTVTPPGNPITVTWVRWFQQAPWAGDPTPGDPCGCGE